MKRFNTYDWSIRKQSNIHEIVGSNCNTKHLVPDWLNERLTRTLMDVVFGGRKGFLPQTPEECSKRSYQLNLRDIFHLQACGVVEVHGTTVKLCREYLSLVKRLKSEGWYYWFGTEACLIEGELERSNRLAPVEVPNEN